MTTMPIDNHPLTQRRLQFIGIGVNKLTFKGIDIMQSSNHNIVGSFICWNQNIVYMKILDTSFKMTKEDLGLGGKDVYYESKMIYYLCTGLAHRLSHETLLGRKNNLMSGGLMLLK